VGEYPWAEPPGPLCGWGNSAQPCLGVPADHLLSVNLYSQKIFKNVWQGCHLQHHLRLPPDLYKLTESSLSKPVTDYIHTA